MDTTLTDYAQSVYPFKSSLVDVKVLNQWCIALHCESQKNSLLSVRRYSLGFQNGFPSALASKVCGKGTIFIVKLMSSNFSCYFFRVEKRHKNYRMKNKYCRKTISSPLTRRTDPFGTAKEYMVKFPRPFTCVTSSILQSVGNWRSFQYSRITKSARIASMVFALWTKWENSFFSMLLKLAKLLDDRKQVKRKVDASGV